jgi:hypothetical protein
VTDQEAMDLGVCPNHPANRLGWCENGPTCKADQERVLAAWADQELRDGWKPTFAGNWKGHLLAGPAHKPNGADK